MDKHQTQILKDFFKSYRKCTKNGFLDDLMFKCTQDSNNAWHLYNIMEDIRITLIKQKKEGQNDREGNKRNNIK